MFQSPPTNHEFSGESHHQMLPEWRRAAPRHQSIHREAQESRGRGGVAHVKAAKLQQQIGETSSVDSFAPWPLLIAQKIAQL